MTDGHRYTVRAAKHLRTAYTRIKLNRLYPKIHD